MPLRLLRSLVRRRGNITPPGEWLQRQNREMEMLRESADHIRDAARTLGF